MSSCTANGYSAATMMATTPKARFTGAGNTVASNVAADTTSAAPRVSRPSQRQVRRISCLNSVVIIGRPP